MKNQALDIIIPFVIATKNNRPIDSENGRVPQMENTKYLLGQMIRQLWIPKNAETESAKSAKFTTQKGKCRAAKAVNENSILSTRKAS